MIPFNPRRSRPRGSPHWLKIPSKCLVATIRFSFSALLHWWYGNLEALVVVSLVILRNSRLRWLELSRLGALGALRPFTNTNPFPSRLFIRWVVDMSYGFIGWRRDDVRYVLSKFDDSTETCFFSSSGVCRERKQDRKILCPIESVPSLLISRPLD